MSSSTSGSDQVECGPATTEADWRRFVLRVVLIAAAMCLAVLLAATALDPYDTGYGLLRFQGSAFNGPRLADASRVHDGTFDSAVFGNSHVMTLSPARLSAATGRRFVMLAVPGTGVPEQMMLLDSYLQRHAPPSALVLGIDSYYCASDPRALPPVPFPDWLYTANPIAYMAGLFRSSTLQALARRLGLVSGWVKPVARDGTFDLYAGEMPDPAVSTARIASTPREDWTLPPGAERVGLRLLDERLRRLAPATRMILLLTPVATPTLPLEGTSAATALTACKIAINDLARSYRNTVVLDWHQPRPGLDVPANFRDATHFYEPVAREVEAEIARALRVQQ